MHEHVIRYPRVPTASNWSASVRRIVRTNDNRVLSVVEYGPVDGFPVLYLHGTPGAASEWLVFGNDDALERHDLRLIAPDRPGMGFSDFQPGRRLPSWTEDVKAIVNAFELQRYSVLGYSGGGAYAVVTAMTYPERVKALSLVAPVNHANEVMTAGLDASGLGLKNLARDHPALARCALMLAMGLPARFAPAMLRQQILKALPQIDREALATDRRLDSFVSTLREAFQSGSRGPALDMRLMASPWDIVLETTPIPTHIFQGTLDTFGARPAMASHIASGLGTRDLQLLQEGHVSIFTTHLEAILTTLRAKPDRPSPKTTGG